MNTDSDYINIFIDGFYDGIQVIEAKSTDTIYKIKYFTSEKVNIPVDNMRFDFNCKSLENNKTLDKYNITNYSTIRFFPIFHNMNCKCCGFK